MASHVVGLIGPKQSGKDTFAARLVSQHGFTRVAFADALKDMAVDLDPLVAPHSRLTDALRVMGGWDGAKQLPEIRVFLQRLGVAVRDHVDRDVWVEIAGRRIRRIPGPVVVTDVRFFNEVDWVKYAGGTVIRIDRPDLDSRDMHVSETELLTYPADHVVTNDRSVDALHATADRFAADVIFETA